jgi:hypothetical protein
VEDNLLANGWKWYPEIELQTRGQSGEELAKYAGDLRLTAVLFKEDWSSVKLVLEAPPLHLGESGFSSP